MTLRDTLEIGLKEDAPYRRAARVRHSDYRSHDLRAELRSPAARSRRAPRHGHQAYASGGRHGRVNRRGAAATLGLKRTTLQSMMKKLGITRPSF